VFLKFNLIKLIFVSLDPSWERSFELIESVIFIREKKTMKFVDINDLRNSNESKFHMDKIKKVECIL